VITVPQLERNLSQLRKKERLILGGEQPNNVRLGSLESIRTQLTHSAVNSEEDFLYFGLETGELSRVCLLGQRILWVK